jgi:hypothetical protein
VFTAPARARDHFAGGGGLVNLKTADAPGITAPRALRNIAEDVIQ